MRVIPVIDILGGIAVHAVKGKRSEYKPLESVLCTSVKPIEIASVFKKLGFGRLYIADLDAIMKKRSNLGLIKQIAKSTGLDLMVDAGTINLEGAEKLLSSGIERVIIGTETLSSMSFVEEAAKTFGQERIVVSIDLKGERVLGKMGLDQKSNPLKLLQDVSKAGVNQIILLDLARVGSSKGVNSSLLFDFSEIIEVEVFLGGGVRNIEDLKHLRKMGVAGVLVATALHLGRFNFTALKQAGFSL